MMSLWEASWVIARRDFVATVWSRTFVIFLLAPIILFGFALLVGRTANVADRAAAQAVVAVVADSATAQALVQARDRIASGISDQALPILRVVQPAEDVGAQAERLVADEEGNYSAVLTGTLERPVLTGPVRIDEGIGRRVQLIVDHARRTAALEAAGGAPPPLAMERVVTEQAAGNLRMIRHAIARGGQILIFMVVLMLATMLLSNLVEEKSNKVIEVLAAAVPLDAVFLGKLTAMLAISLVGLVLWGGMLGVGYLFLQVLQDWMMVPQAGPAIGWPIFMLLLLLYYTASFMLLGALFLGIGGQASNIREVQTLSMPITFVQLMVLLLAMTVVGDMNGLVPWAAYLFPLSSPLAMIALAAQSAALWPHLLALAWQALWVVLIIRVSAGLFRKTVLKSGGRLGILEAFRFRRT